ncbi:Dual specificity protein phosphatase 3 [Acipenser ruthenus]|uniref:protein-tyrosine-phosphatase n=1 Tax=Acipenser ruthenus TaxID=7906 RepID=A0A662Z0Z7_ACIRT|nr:Dual specificity protein phosphatase 3 [Acipenser ruthenus]
MPKQYAQGCIVNRLLLVTDADCIAFSRERNSCIKTGGQKMESIEKWNKDFIALKLLDKKLHSKKNGTTGGQKMESIEKWNKDFIALKLLDKKLHSKKNGTTGVISKHLHQTFKIHNYLQLTITRSECGTGSCPNLIMSRNEQPEQKPVIMALTPQLPVRTHRPLCLSVSSDSNGRFRALESQDWKNNLKAQMEQAHSAGAASSTGSLERASLFCASGSNTSSSSLSSPVEPLTKSKSSSRFSLFSPPWNSSSESDSNPPSRSGSKKLRNYNKRGGNKAEDALDSKQSIPEHFQFSEPVIAKVTDYIYVGNLNAAYSGRILCRNSIDSVIDMSSFASEHKVGLIPCTCSRGTKHSWSRLKVDIRCLSDEESVALKQRSFEDINECIDASTEKRKRVLIHCRDGYSLAPTCIIQYLMVKQNMRLIAAYEFVRAKYPVNIQECHQNLLVNLEKSLRPGENVDPECFKQAISRKMAWT